MATEFKNVTCGKILATLGTAAILMYAGARAMNDASAKGLEGEVQNSCEVSMEELDGVEYGSEVKYGGYDGGR